MIAHNRITVAQAIGSLSPIVAVIWLDWAYFDALAVYWVETLYICIFAALAILHVGITDNMPISFRFIFAAGMSSVYLILSAGMAGILVEGMALESGDLNAPSAVAADSGSYETLAMHLGAAINTLWHRGFAVFILILLGTHVYEFRSKVVHEGSDIEAVRLFALEGPMARYCVFLLAAATGFIAAGSAESMKTGAIVLVLTKVGLDIALHLRHHGIRNVES